MELKNWSEYTDLEQRQILIHAFYYYGKSIFTLQEYEEYMSLISKSTNDILTVYIAAYCCNLCGQTIILKAMREENTDELFIASHKYLERFTEQQVEEIKNQFISECANTINAPEAHLKMSTEELNKQIKELLLRQE